MDSISQKSVCLIPGTHSERGVWPTERVLIFLPWSGCLWWCSFKRRHRIGENSRHRCLSAFQTLFSFFKRLLREILTFFYDYQHSLTIAMLTMLLASSQAFSELKLSSNFAPSWMHAFAIMSFSLPTHFGGSVLFHVVSSRQQQITKIASHASIYSCRPSPSCQNRPLSFDSLIYSLLLSAIILWASNFFEFFHPTQIASNYRLAYYLDLSRERESFALLFLVISCLTQAGLTKL